MDKAAANWCKLASRPSKKPVLLGPKMSYAAGMKTCESGAERSKLGKGKRKEYFFRLVSEKPVLLGLKMSCAAGTKTCESGAERSKLEKGKRKVDHCTFFSGSDWDNVAG